MKIHLSLKLKYILLKKFDTDGGVGISVKIIDAFEFFWNIEWYVSRYI